MVKSYGQHADPDHAKGRTYEGTKTTAKLKAQGKITEGRAYDEASKEGRTS